MQGSLNTAVAVRALLVEDDPAQAAVIGLMLPPLGIEVVAHCVAGEQAIEVAETGEVDLVLMDCMLEGELSGPEAAARITQHHGIPVVLMTANEEAALSIREAWSLDVPWILKPVRPRDLRHAVQLSLGHTSNTGGWQRLLDEAGVASPEPAGRRSGGPSVTDASLLRAFETLGMRELNHG